MVQARVLPKAGGGLLAFVLACGENPGVGTENTDSLASSSMDSQDPSSTPDHSSTTLNSLDTSTSMMMADSTGTPSSTSDASGDSTNSQSMTVDSSMTADETSTSDTHSTDDSTSDSTSGGDSGVQDCGVDLLLLIDNSRSMLEEQASAIAAIPDFIAEVDKIAKNEDVHVLVLNGESYESPICSGDACTCSVPFTAEKCCRDACAQPATKHCNDQACTKFPSGNTCEEKLGAGLTTDATGADCSFDAEKLYLESGQTNFASALSCVTSVGTAGSGVERVMLAINTALSPSFVSSPGCNEGFLRDNSVLAVVAVTDEDDKDQEGSPGNPQQWHEELLATKGGEAQDVVMIGFISDVGKPGALCDPGHLDVGAEESPRLNALMELFGNQGLNTSVCASDYRPTFAQAITKIQAACARKSR